MRFNWVGPTQAPATSRYFQPKDSAFVASDYYSVTAANADGYLDAYFPANITLRGRNIFGRI